MSKKITLFDSLDFSTARQTVINWPNHIAIIVDKYQGDPGRGVSHGVQKDAIQNGWDARIDKKHGKNWGMEFSLVRTATGKFFLAIRDFGTTGLTGRVLKPEELQEDLPAEERWGRFENVAFTKRKEEESLGARGQGKFIFVGASKNYTILYDSLRLNNTYRAGLRTVKITDSPIFGWDEQEGKEKIVKLTENTFNPLSQVGTRVIIVDPIKEVVDDILSGAFLAFIEETWWEIIQKYEARIFLKVLDERIKQAKIPKQFHFPEKDDKIYKTWNKDNVTIKIGNEKFRVKKLRIVYNSKEAIDKDLRGISIQRGGMKICSIMANYIPKNFHDSIYGYIACDKDLDEALKKYENPEHYSFSYRRGSISSELKKYIEDEILKFSREKLGLGIDQRKIIHDRQMNAEKKALEEINKLAGRLGISGSSKTNGGGREPKPHPDPINAPLQVIIPEFTFPRSDSVRVNYGEKIEDINVILRNNTKHHGNFKLKFYLLFGDNKVKDILPNLDFKLLSGEEKKIGPFEETFISSKFPAKGKYTIKAVLLPLENIGEIPKGYDKYYDSRTFYLEADPPSKGLFDQCRGFEYPDDYCHILGLSERNETNNGYIYRYNVNHAGYFLVSNEESDLTDYLVEIMSKEIAWVDLRSEKPQLFSEEEINEPDKLVRKTNEIIGRLLHDYYLGR